MRRSVAVAVLGAALLLVPVAVAATPGRYNGWLYKANGHRWSGTVTMLDVADTPAGQRFRLSLYNMRLTCPYVDRRGRVVRQRLRLVQQGIVQGDFIDDTRRLNRTQLVRVRGRFIDRRFAGRITVGPRAGLTGVCGGSAHVRVGR